MPRMGGAFPFGTNPTSVSLGSGSSWYVPPGNYYNTLPTNLVVEIFNNVSDIWETVPGWVGGSFDGFNMRFRNTTGTCVVASFTAGSGAVNGIGTAATGVTLTPSANGANGRLASLFPIVGGAIGTPAIVNAGSGLVVPPLLIVAPPPSGGRRAVLTCTISAGAVNAVTVVDAGAGYTAAPTVTVIPQLGGYAGGTVPSPGAASLNANNVAVIGSGITIPPFTSGGIQTYVNAGAFTILPVITIPAALTGSGTLTGVGVIDAGALYTGTPTVTVTGAGAATVTLAATVAAANLTFSIYPTLDS